MVVVITSGAANASFTFAGSAADLAIIAWPYSCQNAHKYWHDVTPEGSFRDNGLHSKTEKYEKFCQIHEQLVCLEKSSQNVKKVNQSLTDENYRCMNLCSFNVSWYKQVYGSALDWLLAVAPELKLSTSAATGGHCSCA